MRYTEILEVKRNDVLIDGAVGCIIMILHNCNNNKNTSEISKKRSTLEIEKVSQILILKKHIYKTTIFTTFHEHVS